MRNGPEDVEYEFASGGCRVDPLLKADQIGVDSGWVQNSTLSAPFTCFSIYIRL